MYNPGPGVLRRTFFVEFRTTGSEVVLNTFGNNLAKRYPDPALHSEITGLVLQTTGHSKNSDIPRFVEIPAANTPNINGLLSSEDLLFQRITLSCTRTVVAGKRLLQKNGVIPPG